MQSLCKMRCIQQETSHYERLSIGVVRQAKKRLIFPSCFDIRPESVESVSKVFVASVDIVHVTQDGAPRGCEHS